MTFRLKITQVGKFPPSWSLTKLQDFGTHAYLAMRGSTLPFAPTKTYGPISIDPREKRRNYCFFSLSLSFRSPSLPFVPLLPFLTFFWYPLFLFFLIPFLFLFLKFIFPIISSTRHLDQCEPFTQVHYMSCHVSPDTRCLEKREIQTVLEFDEIRWIN